jgi:hypothetical protein
MLCAQREGKMLENIIDQIPWIFSGIGVFIIGLFITKKVLKNKKHQQNILKNSMGIQAGRDVNIGVKNENTES